MRASFGFGAHYVAKLPVSDSSLVPQALLTAAEAESYVDALRTFTLDEASTQYIAAHLVNRPGLLLPVQPSV